MVAGRCCQRYWSASPGDPARATARLPLRAHRQSSAGTDRRGSRLPWRAFHGHRHDFRTNPFGCKSGRRAKRCFRYDQTSADKQVGESAARFFRADRKHCLEHAASPWNTWPWICPLERVPVAFVCAAPQDAQQSHADRRGSDSERTCSQGISEPLRRRTCCRGGSARCLPISVGRMRAASGERRVCTLPSTDRFPSRRLNARSGWVARHTGPRRIAVDF
jgi:hypothetical protein